MSPIEKLNVTRLIKKFFVFYETVRFITAFNEVHHSTNLLQLNPVHISKSYFIKLFFIIILLLMYEMISFLQF